MIAKDTKHMGKVTTTITISNREDQILAKRGIISEKEVRCITIDDVLVDTGATTLCLPPKIIAQLGLELSREVSVATATGVAKARIFDDARILIGEREGTFECLELPGGAEPLIGVIPLEALGLEPDLKNQKLKVLPSDTAETYLTIL
jgi:clan AA aspartic protease